MRTLADDWLFDFAVSDTFRRYEDHLLDRESLSRCSLRQEREDAYHIRQMRDKNLDWFIWLRYEDDP